MKIYKYDLTVVGCGIAGSMAAISAARQGIRVLAIDEQGYAGGALTGMGTGPMMTFHAGETQVVRGLTEELISRMQARGFSPGHTVDSTGYTYTVTPFSAEGMKLVLDEMFAEAGVDVLYHTVLAAADVHDGRLHSIDCLSCGQSFRIASTLFLDATGDADLLVMSGIPTVCGRSGDGADQPMTMNFKLMGVDIPRVRQIMADEPQLFPFLAPKAGIEKNASRLSISGFQDIMRAGIRSGEVTVDRDIVLCFETNTRGEVIVNMSRILGHSPVDPFSLSQAEAIGRQQAHELYHYLKSHVPGFENTVLLFTGPSVGIRTSRRLTGVYTLTAEDILSEKMFDDRIAIYGYPIDIHSPDGTETEHHFLPWGGSYSIPYRCLINETVPNVLTAGRNISCTFEAQASARTSPCCGALGHAAGAAAALAIQLNTSPLTLPVKTLQAQLLAENAYLGTPSPVEA